MYSTKPLREIHRNLLTGLQEASEKTPQFGVASVLSSSSETPPCSAQELVQCIELAERSLKEAYLLITSHVTTAKRQMNALSPISRLPPEILSEILEMACALDQGEMFSEEELQGPGPIKSLLTLAAVSSQFFSVVMDTATLWAIADWRCSPDQVKTYLKRSKDSLIKVKYDSISMTCLRNRDSKNLWWEDSPILEHMARWGDVELALDFEAELEGLCGLAAPELRKLAIDYRSGPLSKPVHLFEGNTPKLRTMDLRGVHLHWEWDAAMIANLRSLALQGVQISKASTQSFLSVVRSAPMLEELILRNLQLDSDANLRPASPSNLNLHSLKELCITDVSYDIFRYFFGTIRAPNVKKVALDLPSFWNVEGWSKLLLGCLDNALLKLVGEARRLELYFDHRTFQMSGIPDVGPPSLFRLEWESLRLPLEAVEWVLKNILVYRKWPTLTVRFSGCMETYIQNILPSLFWLEDVTAVELELDVPFEYSPDHSFLSCRSVSVTDRPAAGKQWLWPNLTTVTINGQGWVGAGDYMLSIVNSRRQASSDPNDLNSIGVSRKVVPIQRVRIKDLSKLSESAAEQLQSLVPDIQLPSPEQLITASPTPNSGELNVFQRILDLLSG